MNTFAVPNKQIPNLVAWTASPEPIHHRHRAIRATQPWRQQSIAYRINQISKYNTIRKPIVFKITFFVLIFILSPNIFGQLLPWPAWADQPLSPFAAPNHSYYDGIDHHRYYFLRSGRNSKWAGRFGLRYRPQGGQIAIFNPWVANAADLRWGAVETNLAGITSVTPILKPEYPNRGKLEEVIVCGFDQTGMSAVKKLSLRFGATRASVTVSTYLHPIQSKIGVAEIIDDKLWISDLSTQAVSAYVDSNDDGIFDQLAVGPLALPVYIVEENDTTWGFVKLKEIIERKDLVVIIHGDRDHRPGSADAPNAFLSVDLSESSPSVKHKSVIGNLIRHIPHLYDARGATDGAQRLRIYHGEPTEKLEVVLMSANGTATRLCKPFLVTSNFIDVTLSRALVAGEVIRIRVEGQTHGRTYRATPKCPHLFPGPPSFINLSNPDIKAVSFEGVNLLSSSHTVELWSDSNSQTISIGASDYVLSSKSLSIRRDALLARFTGNSDRVYIRLTDAAGEWATKNIFVVR